MGVRALSRLYATEVGRRVALSGLLPETAHFLLQYLCENNHSLIQLLPDESGTGGNIAGLNYCLVSAALMSPEFSGLTRTRFIHYGFEDTVPNPRADRWGRWLAGQPWQAYRSAVNSAAIMMEWIDGASLSGLERRFQAIRAGTIEGLCREVVWCLSGLADIIAVATQADSAASERPVCLRDVATETLLDIRRLLPSLRLLSWRLNVGLPETVIWLTDAQGSDGRALVSRREALALSTSGLGRHEAIRQRSNWNSLIAALREAGIPDAHDRARLIQDLADNRHMSLRDKLRARQIRSGGHNSAALINAFYEERGTEFELAFEGLLNFSDIRYTRFDLPPKVGAFDYVLHIENRPDFPIECKSKQANSLVGWNDATDVLRATELHGYAGASCATLCQPGVDPNVPATLLNCARLCVVEAHDLADVLVRIATRRASPQDLHDWLSQPGQAKLETFIHTIPDDGL